ncbi:MAG: MBOAT family protein [Deltaproteobacteria bacterium]|nr:MBOAT family protein [Candidatus Zymogenaceae bacterium]
MILSSLLYIMLFFVAAGIYFLLPQRIRWLFLLLFGYYFYLYWGIVPVLVLLYVTAASYAAGLVMGRPLHGAVRKAVFVLSVVCVLLPLVYFKYAGFLAESAAGLLDLFGVTFSKSFSHVAVPTGISFFTFLAVAYLVDVYRTQVSPEKNPGVFALFISFFPIVLSGPIERAGSLIPQLKQTPGFDAEMVQEGLKRFFFGLFKKIVIADRLAMYVNEVYGNYDEYTGLALVLAIYFYSFQIYCDFSGYTDMAIGSAQILGINVMENFQRPYLARSIPDFWRRWHISLSRWLRDYIYIPLGGNRVTRARLFFNIFVTFFICGLWHGANWTFVFWGLLYCLYYVVHHLTAKKSRVFPTAPPAKRPWLNETGKILLTFHLVTFAWIFFRSASMYDAVALIAGVGRGPFFSGSLDVGLGVFNLVLSLVLVGCLIVWEVLSESAPLYIERVKQQTPLSVKICIWAVFVLSFFLLGVFHGTDFIYFNF